MYFISRKLFSPSGSLKNLQLRERDFPEIGITKVYRPTPQPLNFQIPIMKQAIPTSLKYITQFFLTNTSLIHIHNNMFVGRNGVVGITTRFIGRFGDWIPVGGENFTTHPDRSQGKVKCTLVQALRLCTGRTAHTGSRGIALLFHDQGTRKGWGASVTPRPLFTPGKDTTPIVQEAGWAPEPVSTGAENLALTGIRTPDRPVYSQSPTRGYKMKVKSV
jgi:hypothetical protein